MVILISEWRIAGWHRPELTAYDEAEAASPEEAIALVRRRLPSPGYDAGSRLLQDGEATLREAWLDSRHPARDFARCAGVPIAIANYTDGEVYDIYIHWPSSAGLA